MRKKQARASVIPYLEPPGNYNLKDSWDATSRVIPYLEPPGNFLNHTQNEFMSIIS